MFEYLLPNAFKKIGLGLYILSFLMMIFAKYLEFNPAQRENFIILTALIGFGLIINSKEKVEDERTMLCRYKALGKTFRFILLMFLFLQLIDLFILGLPAGQTHASFFTVSVLVYYGTFEKLLRNTL